jgi:hypothetical protein
MNVKSRINIDDRDIERVEKFAKETGDLKTLSLVDKWVIAFGITLSREKNEYNKLIAKP